MRVTKKIREEQLAILEETYRGAKPELIFHNPFELLIAVILSAQCTDKRVNVTTKRLFSKVKSPEDIMAMGLAALENEIRDCGLFRNKAKNILAACQMLCTEFGGVVPSDLDALQRLPGVGRKTANVVGAVIWGKEVMPVDTHVFRVSARIGLTRGAKTPLQTELQLEKNIPSHLLPVAHHWLILHGRYVCTARAPKCDACGIAPWCKSREKQKMADK